MRPSRTLASRIAITGVGFLLLALVSIALTLLVTWQLEGGAAAVNEAGRMRMITYRLAYAAARGDAAEQREQTAALEATLALLAAGDAGRPLFLPRHEDARTAFAAVQRSWTPLHARWEARQAVPVQDVATFVAGVERLVAVIEQRLSHWTAVLRGFQFAMLALALVATVSLLYLTHAVVLHPLRRLTDGVHAVGAGDFEARVELPSTDEFGRLAEGFNAMAARLQALYRNLEEKVREETRRLEVKRSHLATLYELSAFVARADTLDQLAHGFAVRARRAAHADAVAVRWADDANRRYLMLAHDGLPEDMALDEQCLFTGDCHCGQPAAGAGLRVIPIASPGQPTSHCSRAGFGSLVSVPFGLHQRVLGEVDLFFREPECRLSGEEQALIETMAGHLGGGIEGLRTAAAERESAVAAERGLLAQELHDSIAQSLAFLKIQVALLRDAVQRGDDAASAQAIGELEAGVLESTLDVRELLLHFRTRADADDIEAALRITLQKFQHQSGIAAELQVKGHGVPLPADARVQVLHVLQEALSNVRKHARATRVRVHVQQAPEWRFEVWDDGCGFDPTGAPGAAHVGLDIMRERASRIGADLEIRSRPGEGTCVGLTVSRAVAAATEPDVDVAAEPWASPHATHCSGRAAADASRPTAPFPASMPAR